MTPAVGNSQWNGNFQLPFSDELPYTGIAAENSSGRVWKSGRYRRIEAAPSMIRGFFVRTSGTSMAGRAGPASAGPVPVSRFPPSFGLPPFPWKERARVKTVIQDPGMDISPLGVGPFEYRRLRVRRTLLLLFPRLCAFCALLVAFKRVSSYLAMAHRAAQPP
ncbi:hypothetical protein [Mycetohabitans endofungorum]|uniref:hypothetical protein n=1 Tax=Mycetohabitans endofungorum TaxID=417203 RepID=UPI002B053345|nr:hypothetical protein [Mycetohabitans endofungorum]